MFDLALRLDKECLTFPFFNELKLDYLIKINRLKLGRVKHKSKRSKQTGDPKVN